jgi:hypothetical protein
VLDTTPARTVLAVALGVALYQAWLVAQSAGKVPDELVGTADSRGNVAVEVELTIPAERFHILELQQYGRIRGTDGEVMQLRSVPLDALDDLARLYWVRELRLPPST